MANGQRVGYLRVSSLDQSTARQLDGELLDRRFEDKASGKDVARPQLQEMLAYVRHGDTVVCHSLDRLGRDLMDLQNLVKDLTGRGVQVEFKKEGLVFSGEDSPMNNLLLGLLGSVAAFERAQILSRQAEGIVLAKARGVYKGRARVLSPERAAELRARAAAGESKTALAAEFEMSRSAVYVYLKGA